MKPKSPSKASLPQLLLPIVIALLTQALQAAEDSDLAWRGFLTTGVAVSDSDQEYKGGINQTPNFHKYSRFGLNLNSKVSPSIDVAAQLVAYKDTLHPDWAFASWYPFNGFAIRVGKQKFPIWLLSDRLDVGKTYPWITPPEEVYGQNPIKAITGIGASYNLELASFEILTEVIFGSMKESIEGEQRINSESLVTDVTADDVMAGNLVIGNDTIKLRAGGATARVKTENKLYTIKRVMASLWSYGIQANYHGFLLLSEYATISAKVDKKEQRKANKEAADAVFRAGSSDDELVKMQAQQAVLNALVHNSSLIGGKAWNITTGYQAGDWMPHITYARMITPANSLSFGDQYSVTTGLKYDINPATDLKIEWQRVTPEDGSWGMFNRSGLDSTEKFEPINIYSIAMDFVF